MADSFEVQLNKVIDNFSEDFKRHVETAQKNVAKDAAQKLRSTSPKRSGAYARGWSVKTTKEHGNLVTIVYNKDHYQLTHLLENGHVIRNKKGTYGRTSPTKHIEPVEQEANSKFVEEVERGI